MMSKNWIEKSCHEKSLSQKVAVTKCRVTKSPSQEILSQLGTVGQIRHIVYKIEFVWLNNKITSMKISKWMESNTTK